MGIIHLHLVCTCMYIYLHVHVVCNLSSKSVYAVCSCVVKYTIPGPTPAFKKCCGQTRTLPGGASACMKCNEGLMHKKEPEAR